MKSLYIFIFIIYILLVGNLISQKEQPPQGSQPKDFVLPAVQKSTLGNGMQIILVPYGDLPKALVRVVMNAGNINETAQETWLADLTADLLKEGTTTLDASAIAQKAASMGGAINVSTGADQSWIGGEVLSEFTPELIELLADILQNPIFPEKEFDRLKKDYLRNLSMAKAEPGQLAQEKFLQILYPDHPYGRLFPSEQMLADFTLEKVKNFYNKNYGSARASIYVVGRFDETKVEKAIKSSFSNWQKGPEPFHQIPSPVAQRKIYLVDRPNAPQSTIYIGLPVIDPTHTDYFPLQVTNMVLGGYFSSRVTANIREEKGYTYSPISYITNNYRSAYWLQVADVSTEVTGASIREISYEIDRLQNEVVPLAELKSAQNYMAGIFILRNSSRAGILNQLSFIDLHGLPADYLTSYVKNIYSVTPQDVQKMAQTYLRDEKMTMVIVGDKKLVPEQVQSFAEIVY
jgi:zinc protease